MHQTELRTKRFLLKNDFVSVIGLCQLSLAGVVQLTLLEARYTSKR
ncbi:hypothetical protein AB4278_00030 [Vibrio splendidus]